MPSVNLQGAAVVNRLWNLLQPLYMRRSSRSVLKALLPVRYHQSLRTWLRSTSGVQWCRVVMNQEIERFIRSLDCANIDALEISGSGSKDRYGFRSYQIAQYPDYDICNGPLAPDGFDLVIAEQVFEHVLRPDLAAANVYRMLRPGGVFVISTPFLLKIHASPWDLHRWTEHGMRQLLETAGFVVAQTGSWGNRECLFADMTPGGGWTPYDAAQHSLDNEPQFPIVVWAFAKKRKTDDTRG
jgi:SAM-dependent methyltransferase